MPLILVPTVLVMKYRHQQRKWEYLRAGNPNGNPVARVHPRAPRTSGVSAIGAGVPAVSVLGAFLTTLLWDSPVASDAAIVPVFAWICAAVISALALGTSLRLASMSRDAAHEAELSAAMSDGKPVYDPDAFDVVSSRG